MSVLGGAGNLNYKIGGSLPFQPAGNPILGTAQIAGGLGMPQGVVQGMDTLAQQYGQSYQSALSQNQAMYGNILQGYQQLMGNQVANQQGITQGYGALGNQVQGTIAGVGASEKQAIQDVYAQQQGQQSQGLINRGLGNATVMDSMNRGLTLDEQKAQVALANQMAQLQAGYQANIGMAGLGYQNQANMQNTALGAQQLGWMNSVTSAYPDPNQYNALFGQAGQFHQANQDRRLMQQLGTARGSGGGGGGPPPGVHVQQMPGLSPMGTSSFGGDYGRGGFAGGGGFGGIGSMANSAWNMGGAGGGEQNLVIDPTTGQLVDQSQSSDNFGPYAGGMAEASPADEMAGFSQGFMDAYGPGSSDPFAGGFIGDANTGGYGGFAMDPSLIDPTMSGQSYDFSGFGSPGDFGGLGDLGYYA